MMKIREDLWQYLQRAEKPILLYGMGKGAESIHNRLRERGIGIDGIFASDGFVRGHSFLGHKVLSYGEARDLFGEMIVLLAFGSSLPPVLDNIKRIAKEQELYAPDLPVYGEGLFDLSYAAAHRQELSSVYERLSDELSRDTFEKIVAYRLTGKIDFLFSCESPVSEGYGLLELGKDEVYVDLGAYRGETVTEFLEYAGGCRRILAVEPDEKTFQKLSDALKEIPGAEALQAAAGEASGSVFFAMRGGRNSSAGGGEKGKWIRQEPLDRLAMDATYVKMDVEGAEGRVIAGGRELIAKKKPKLRISCYHRTEDLFSLPLQVLSLRPDYRVYLRHHPYLPWWDTEYYFV